MSIYGGLEYGLTVELTHFLPRNMELIFIRTCLTGNTSGVNPSSCPTYTIMGIQHPGPQNEVPINCQHSEQKPQSGNHDVRRSPICNLS
jgi:hypothetical protein